MTELDIAVANVERLRKEAARVETLRRRIEAVERLTDLVKRDGPDSIWADLLPEAQARLTASRLIQVGDHDPEPRR